MKNRIVALVPMRHDSKRVPGKNYRLFDGLPLYHHIINSLLACPLIAKVVIDTDSPIITKDAMENFPQVQILERPEHIRADTIPMNEVLLHDVSQIKADFYFQTHSTNPLLKTETITKAIESFLGKYPEYDSLFSVTRLNTRLWDQLVRPVNHNPAILLRTQDLPPIFEENSNIYIFSRNTLQTRRNRLGERPLMFEIGALESTDIDEELDFRIAELLYTESRRK